MCEYCKGKYFYEIKKDLIFNNIIGLPDEKYSEPPMLSITDGLITVFNEDGLYGKKILYCPMCGRKLGD